MSEEPVNGAAPEERPADRGWASPGGPWAAPGSPPAGPPNAAAPGYPTPGYPATDQPGAGYPAPSPPGYPAPGQSGYPVSGQSGYPAPGQPAYPVSGYPGSDQPASGYPASGQPGSETPGYPGPAYPPAGPPLPRYAPQPHPGYGQQPLPPPPPQPAYPGYPGPQMGPQIRPPVAPPGYGVQPAGGGTALAMRVDLIEGTQFGVAYPAVPPTPSGPAIGSMVAGIVSILISFVVCCFGITGSTDGWGPAVSGAFAVLAAFIGGGAIGMGLFAARQIRRSGGSVRGRGMAIAGISCGGSGIGLTVLFFLLAVVATAGSQ